MDVGPILVSSHLVTVRTRIVLASHAIPVNTISSAAGIKIWQYRSKAYLLVWYRAYPI